MSKIHDPEASSEGLFVTLKGKGFAPHLQCFHRRPNKVARQLDDFVSQAGLYLFGNMIVGLDDFF